MDNPTTITEAELRDMERLRERFGPDNDVKRLVWEVRRLRALLDGRQA